MVAGSWMLRQMALTSARRALGLRRDAKVWGVKRV
jgi:hypothetical protein